MFGGVLDGMGTYICFESSKDGAVPYKTVERGTISDTPSRVAIWCYIHTGSDCIVQYCAIQ